MKKIILLLTMFILGLSFVFGDICTETDGGDDMYTQGTTTSDVGTPGMPAGSYTDFCLSDLSLMEYACPTNSSEVVDALSISCTSGYTCEDGACVEELSILIEDCNNTLDDDDNGYIDYSGGFDVDSDNAIELRCGCANYNPRTRVFSGFLRFGDLETSCPRSKPYVCQDVISGRIRSNITSGDIRGVYYNADSACPSGLSNTTFMRTASLEKDSFFKRIWSFVFFLERPAAEETSLNSGIAYAPIEDTVFTKNREIAFWKILERANSEYITERSGNDAAQYCCMYASDRTTCLEWSASPC